MNQQDAILIAQLEDNSHGASLDCLIAEGVARILRKICEAEK